MDHGLIKRKQSKANATDEVDGERNLVEYRINAFQTYPVNHWESMGRLPPQAVSIIPLKRTYRNLSYLRLIVPLEQQERDKRLIYSSIHDKDERRGDNLSHIKEVCIWWVNNTIGRITIAHQTK